MLHFEKGLVFDEISLHFLIESLIIILHVLELIIVILLELFQLVLVVSVGLQEAIHEVFLHISMALLKFLVHRLNHAQDLLLADALLQQVVDIIYAPNGFLLYFSHLLNKLLLVLLHLLI